MIQNDLQRVGYWDSLLPHEVLLPTIFDASELRSDFNGKVMRGSVATMPGGKEEPHHFLLENIGTYWETMFCCISSVVELLLGLR